MEEIIVPIVAVTTTLIGLPWLVFHYITKWKTAATLTTQDEDLLEDLHDLARRLDDRVVTIERIMDAENPAWRATALSDAPDTHRLTRQPRMQETRR
jgi:phage shock protein B